jgi:epoxyqueuosine reductase
MTFRERRELLQAVREKARELGFDALGVAPPGPLARGEFYEGWLGQGFGGEMAYLRRGQESRKDPRALSPDIRSVLVLAMNYHTGETPPRPGGLLGAISRYAWGRDYHHVIKRRLKELAHFIEAQGKAKPIKCYVDTGPIIERELAARAGLGWIGKHTNVIRQGLGSWFFLGEIFLDVELPYGEPAQDLCGTCRRCIDACPTGAIVAPYVMDARRCISYLNIELRGWIPRGLRPLMENWVFGCDECQAVCPWNREVPKTSLDDFRPRDGLKAPDLIELLSIGEKDFDRRFEGSPIRRARWTGLMRNVAVALGNSGDPAAIEPLGRALESPEPLLRGHAAWALGRIGGNRARDLLKMRLEGEEEKEVRREIEEALAEAAHSPGVRVNGVCASQEPLARV